MNDKVTALDDTEVGDWLIALIEEGSDSFLCALAEAALTADAEDYRVIRPALIELKRKYLGSTRKQIPSRRFVPRQTTPHETRGVRSPMP